MAVGPNTIVVNVTPDMSRERFTAVLRAANSPALAEADAGYDAVVAERVSVRFALAIFAHESNYGNLGVTPTYGTKNPGNCRSSRTGAYPLVNVPGKGNYVKYPTWAAGWRDLAHRIVDQTFVYVQEGRDTIGEIITRWAPPSDDNNTQAYINTVVTRMNGWGDETPEPEPTPMPTPIIYDIRNDADAARFGLTPAERNHLLTRCFPNRNGAEPRAVLYHIQDGSTSGSLDWWVHGPGVQASSTVMIQRDGSILRVIPEKSGPWTNGKVERPTAASKTLRDLGGNPNNWSLTIEFEGAGGQPLTPAQFASGVWQTRDWKARYPKITDDMILGHFTLDQVDRPNCPDPPPHTLIYAPLKAAVAGTAPIPPPPTVPPPTPGIDYPDHVDGGIAARMFGSVVGEDGVTYVYSEAPGAVVSPLWLAEGKRRGEFPELVKVWSYEGGARRFFRFANGMTFFVGGNGVPVIVK